MRTNDSYQMYLFEHQRNFKFLRLRQKTGLPWSCTCNLHCQAKQPPNQWLNYLQKAFRIAKNRLGFETFQESVQSNYVSYIYIILYDI